MPERGVQLTQGTERGRARVHRRPGVRTEPRPRRGFTRGARGVNRVFHDAVQDKRRSRNVIRRVDERRAASTAARQDGVAVQPEEREHRLGQDVATLQHDGV